MVTCDHKALNHGPSPPRRLQKPIEADRIPKRVNYGEDPGAETHTQCHTQTHTHVQREHIDTHQTLHIHNIAVTLNNSKTM